GVSVSPAARRAGLYFATEPDGFFTADKVVPFLRDLLKHLRGQVLVVWDRGGNHKGPVIRKFLSKNRRLRLEMLPPWAPELNPGGAVLVVGDGRQVGYFRPGGPRGVRQGGRAPVVGLEVRPRVAGGFGGPPQPPFS